MGVREGKSGQQGGQQSQQGRGKAGVPPLASAAAAKGGAKLVSVAEKTEASYFCTFVPGGARAAVECRS